MNIAARFLGWAAVGLFLTPLLYAAWISFSPDAFLTPPTGEWSLRWYRSFANNRRLIAALGRSLGFATLAAVVATLAATPLAFAVARYRFRGRRFLNLTGVLPNCVPPAALGMGLLPILLELGWWRNPVGLILTHAMLGLPVGFLILRSHFEQTPADLEAAARGLGASPTQVVMRITLPLIRPAIFACALAAFVISLNEAMVTIFLATPETETLPAVIWPQLRFAASPIVAVASGLSILLAATAILAVSRWLRK